MHLVNLSPERVRTLFNANLSYEKIDQNDIEALNCLIGLECAKHNRDISFGLIHGVKLHLPKKKCYAPIVRMSKEHPGIKEAYLRIDGDYFSGREAVSFNCDGFVGFAGWADRNNVQPILQGFVRWMTEWKGIRLTNGGAL